MESSCGEGWGPVPAVRYASYRRYPTMRAAVVVVALFAVAYGAPQSPKITLDAKIAESQREIIDYANSVQSVRGAGCGSVVWLRVFGFSLGVVGAGHYCMRAPCCVTVVWLCPPACGPPVAMFGQCIAAGRVDGAACSCVHVRSWG